MKSKDEEKENLKNLKKEEDILFLPMNFNLVLDYFNNKGKQRGNTDNILNAIKIMEQVTNNQKITSNKEKINKDQDKMERRESIVDSSDLQQSKMKSPEEELKIHNERVTEDLLEGFQQLFINKHASENANNSNRIVRRMLNMDLNSNGQTISSREGTKKYLSKLIPLNSNNNLNTNKFTLNSESTLNNNTILRKEDNDCFIANQSMPFSNFILNKINTKSLYKDKNFNFHNFNDNLKSKKDNFYNSKYSNFGMRSTANSNNFNNNNLNKSNISNLPSINNSKTYNRDYLPKELFNDLTSIKPKTSQDKHKRRSKKF